MFHNMLHISATALKVVTCALKRLLLRVPLIKSPRQKNNFVYNSFVIWNNTQWGHVYFQVSGRTLVKTQSISNSRGRKPNWISVNSQAQSI